MRKHRPLGPPNEFRQRRNRRQGARSLSGWAKKGGRGSCQSNRPLRYGALAIWPIAGRAGGTRIQRMAADFSIHPAYAAALKWSRRGSCGRPGCKDPECCCSFCGLPIGVPEDDLRWDDHDEFCGDCELCRDQVPLLMFRGEGKQTEGVQLHWACAQRIMHFRSRAG